MLILVQVMHDCRSIAGCLIAQFGVKLTNVFDTQVNTNCSSLHFSELNMMITMIMACLYFIYFYFFLQCVQVADVMCFYSETGGFLPDRVSTLQEVVSLHLKVPSSQLLSLQMKSQLTKVQHTHTHTHTHTHIHTHTFRQPPSKAAKEMCVLFTGWKRDVVQAPVSCGPCWRWWLCQWSTCSRSDWCCWILWWLTTWRWWIHTSTVATMNLMDWSWSEWWVIHKWAVSCFFLPPHPHLTTQNTLTSNRYTIHVRWTKIKSYRLSTRRVRFILNASLISLSTKLFI